MSADDLLALLPIEPGRTDALDWFVGTCLTEGGIWDSPRTSDGIAGIERVLERGPDALRITGRIGQIDQSVQMFWLEIRRVADRFAWVLYFDVAESSPRRARNAFTSHDDPEAIRWRAKLAGEAHVEDDTLTIVPGSVVLDVGEDEEPESE